MFCSVDASVSYFLSTSKKEKWLIPNYFYGSLDFQDRRDLPLQDLPPPPDTLGREGLPRLNSQSIAYAISRGRKSMTWGKERSTYIFFQSNKKTIMKKRLYFFCATSANRRFSAIGCTRCKPTRRNHPACRLHKGRICGE